MPTILLTFRLATFYSELYKKPEKICETIEHKYKRVILAEYSTKTIRNEEQK